MGFDAYLWKRPAGEAETPYDFEEVCEWSGRSQYGWMHQWFREHGKPSEQDEDTRLLTAADLVAFHEELVRRHEDSPSDEEDREIIRVAGWIEPSFEDMTDDDRFTYYGSF